MAKVFFDGEEHAVRDGVNLVEAGKDAGVEIPHFCYHPRLRIVGQCRMCLVEVEGMPKVQVACNIAVKDGMKVTTRSEKVLEARASVLEFLLYNHPLDCPICDKAGECLLQDNSFGWGNQDSRSIEIRRTYPGRERLPIGPHVIFNMNRCIHCTRCIRFTEEITETKELGFFERSGRTEVGIYPGRPLDNALSACVTDICPVGALTVTEFRFRARVWNLSETASVCAGCNVGCNITVESAKGQIHRYMPRVNPQVNDYWMCDVGRFSFMADERETRLVEPQLSVDGAARRGTSWRVAIDTLARKLNEALSSGSPRRIMALGSPFLTNEENFLISWLFGDTIGSPNLDTAADPADPARQLVRNPAGWLHGTDAAPNLAGARQMGIAPRTGGLTLAALVEARPGGPPLDVLYVADGGFAAGPCGEEGARALRAAARFLVVGGWRETPLTAAADLVLPGARFAEKEGTWTNIQGRLQRLRRAFAPPGEARADWEILVALGQHFSPNFNDLTPRSIYAEAARMIPALAGVPYPGSAEPGPVLPGTESGDQAKGAFMAGGEPPR